MKFSLSLEPLRFLLHPIALLAFAAAAQAWIEGATIRGIVTAALGVLIAAATEAARKRVTPVAGWRDHLEDGYSLVEVLIALILIVFLIWLVVTLLPGDADAALAVAKSWG